MCLNCGCGRPDDPHGNAANITADDLRRAGRANGHSMETSARNILAGVEQVDQEEPVDAGTPAGPGEPDRDEPDAEPAMWAPGADGPPAVKAPTTPERAG